MGETTKLILELGRSQLFKAMLAQVQNPEEAVDIDMLKNAMLAAQRLESTAMQSHKREKEIRQAFAEASEALGEDLWQMVADGPAEVLAQTVNTQPLMLTAGVAIYREWIARGGALPSLVAGHSLGEYSALVVAGALDFQEAVKLVRLRAQAMQEAVPQGEGAMAALLGLDEAAAVDACAEAAQGEVVSAANLNSPGQIVIAGARAAVERAMERNTPTRGIDRVSASITPRTMVDFPDKPSVEVM